MFVYWYISMQYRLRDSMLRWLICILDLQRIYMLPAAL